MFVEATQGPRRGGPRQRDDDKDDEDDDDDDDLQKRINGCYRLPCLETVCTRAKLQHFVDF